MSNKIRNKVLVKMCNKMKILNQIIKKWYLINKKNKI